MNGTKNVIGYKVWDIVVIDKMIVNKRYKGVILLQITFTEGYQSSIRKNNIDQHFRYNEKRNHLSIISLEIFYKVHEEIFNRARQLKAIHGSQISSGNRYSNDYLHSKLSVSVIHTTSIVEEATFSRRLRRYYGMMSV